MLNFVFEFRSNTTSSVAPAAADSHEDVRAYLKGHNNNQPVVAASEYDFRSANPWTHPRADVYRDRGRASGLVDAVVCARTIGDKGARFKKSVTAAGSGSDVEAPDVVEVEDAPQSVLALLSRQSSRMLHSAVVCYFLARDETTLKREIMCRGPVLCVLSPRDDFTVFWNKLINDTSSSPSPSPVFVPAAGDDTRDDGRATSVTACILGWTAAAEWIIGTSFGATSDGIADWGLNGCFRVPFVSSWWLSSSDDDDHAIVACLPLPTFEGAFDRWSTGSRESDGDGDVVIRVWSPLPPAVSAKLCRRSEKRCARRARGPGPGPGPRVDTAPARPTTRLTLGHGKNKGMHVFGDGGDPKHAVVLKERLRALVADRFQVYTHAEWRDVVVLVTMTLLIVFVLALSCSRRGRRFLFA